MKKEIVILKQKHPIFKCPSCIQRMFTKTYYAQGLVQFDGKKLTTCGDKIKWLEEFQITALSTKAGDKLAFDYLKQIYPMYTNYIQLFNLYNPQTIPKTF